MSTATPAHTVIQIAGADAGTFLRAQLTIDVQRLTHDQHGLTAWCDAKGRALCTLRILPVDAGYLLILPTDLAATISRRLRMYVLRAQVDISDVTAQWALSGILHASTDKTLPANGAVVHDAAGYTLGLDTGNGPGALRLRHTQELDGADPLSDNRWQLAAVDAGLPELSAATSGLFVPQMLNLHRLGGIEFDKGCYPGQEVIARLHYRGRLTRHMMRLHWQGTTQPAPGDDVISDAGTRQGTVVRSACSEPGAGRLLAVMRTHAVQAELTSGDTRLALLDLPYAMTDAAAANA